MPFLPLKALLWAIWAGLWMLPADAQIRVEEGAEISVSGQAYLKALRFRGIETDMAYFDPSRPPPDLDTKKTPDPSGINVDVSLDRNQGTMIVNALSLAVLLGIAYVVLRFGGQFSVSLRRDQDARRDRADEEPRLGPSAAVPDNLDVIAHIEDRKLALITLAQSALIRAVRNHGLLLQRSWTARDALRRLPHDMRHRDALQGLVAAGERVLFGGRDVTEAVFQDHLDQIRPLFTEAAA